MLRRVVITTEKEQGAGFVELFFDLAFVFAVTEVTAFTAHHLDFSGVTRAVLIFWLIWWGWTQWTWALNSADTDHGLVRMGTLVATGIAFLMAASVDQAFTDEVMWFVIPYLAIRLLGLALYYWVAFGSRDQRIAVIAFSVLSLSGLSMVLVGALLDPPARNWLWLLAILLDLGAAGAAGSLPGWNIRAGHFAERHGLFVIIALGESLIVAGTSVAEPERTNDLIVVAVLTVTVACLLWWTYFGWVKDALERRLAAAGPRESTLLSRDAYSFIHFLIVGGIVGFAVGVEEMVLHPTVALPDEFVLALGVGIALFVGGTAAAYLRATWSLLVPRLLILALGLVVLAVAASQDPWVLLAIVAVTLLAVTVAEHGRDDEGLRSE
jgi:low temperature requirement protein LtrA